MSSIDSEDHSMNGISNQELKGPEPMQGIETAKLQNKRATEERETLPANEPPNKKPFKLAIQKDPPARAKALADPNFFSTIRGNKKYTPANRPIYHVDDILKNINPSSTVSKPDPFSTTTNKESTKKKRVRFKDDLVEIREYERNPEEWTSFSDDVRPPYYQTPWYSPFELNLVPKPSSGDGDGVTIPRLIETPEVKIQEKREKLVLAATYLSPQHIPPSPAEPDEAADPKADATLPIIPLTNNTREQKPPVINQNMITPENLNAAAAIAAAMNDVFKAPSQQPYISPPSTTPVSAPYTPPSYAPRPTPPAPMSTSYAPPPPSLSAPVSTKPPTSTPSPNPQIQISNQTVEAMLKNNPDIMQSLKQLSVLAGSILETPSTQTQTQPQYGGQYTQQYQPQKQFQQPQFQPQQPQQPQYQARPYPYQQKQKQQQQQQQQQQQRQNKNKKKKTRNANPAPCMYYKAGTCRKGANCAFSHID